MNWLDNIVDDFFEWMFQNFWFFIGAIVAMLIILLILWGGGE